MDDKPQFESTYTENAHRLKIKLKPADAAEIEIEHSKLRYEQTVVRLREVVERIREVPGVESAFPRGDSIQFTVAKEDQEAFSRILDDILLVIQSEVENATSQTRARLEELSEQTVPQDELGDEN